MNQVINYKILSNIKLNHDTYELVLEGPTNWYKPGKFINIKIANKLLRRPMSVCKVENNKMTVVYKIIGEGTCILSGMLKGEFLEILIDLGNNYEIQNRNDNLIIAGGCGIGSIYMLAKEFAEKKINFKVILGFKTKNDVFYENEFRKLTNDLLICTDDGTYGLNGRITDVIKNNNLQDYYYYACGSANCLKAIFKTCKQGQLSLESKMGCGYGVCMGCSIRTKNGFKRVCKEGPVFRSEELLW